PSVAAGIQRIGRAGHRVGEPSTGIIFPKYRGDLLEAAVVTERMLAGAIEETRVPKAPLDVLAQQLVAMCSIDRWRVGDLHALVTRADAFRDLSREQLDGETFLRGASTWRIEEIKPGRVIVTPAPGEPGKMPFWKGDQVGRPIELGRAVGAFLRELEPMPAKDVVKRLERDHALDERAA